MSKIIFENQHFVVCDKDALTLSVPARDMKDPRPCLGLELQKKLNQQVFPVHRLDYEVSGLIMYALNAKAHRAAQDWFQQKKIQKTYLALTSGQNFSHWPENVKTDRSVLDVEKLRADQTELVWKTQILKGKKRSFESSQGEWAETHATVLEVQQDKILWQLKPVTGKSHQLRLELSRRGFAIHGDQLYGSKVKHILDGVALRAVHLDLKKCDSKKWDLPEQYSVEKGKGFA